MPATLCTQWSNPGLKNLIKALWDWPALYRLGKIFVSHPNCPAGTLSQAHPALQMGELERNGGERQREDSEVCNYRRCSSLSPGTRVPPRFRDVTLPTCYKRGSRPSFSPPPGQVVSREPGEGLLCPSRPAEIPDGCSVS